MVVVKKKNCINIQTTAGKQQSVTDTVCAVVNKGLVNILEKLIQHVCMCEITAHAQHRVFLNVWLEGE